MSIARSVGRNAVYTALGRFSVLLVWFLVTPRVLEALGTARFGFWSILLLFTGSLAMLDLGLGVAVTRAVGAAMGRRDGHAALGFVTRAFALQLVLAAAFAAVLYVLREPLLDAFRVPAEWRDEALRGYLFALSGFVLLVGTNLLMATLQGLQRMDLSVPVAVPLAIGLFVGVQYAADTATPLAALTLVQLVYAAALALGLAVVVGRVLTAQAAADGPTKERISLRAALRIGGMVQLSGLFGLVQAQIDKVILGTLVALTPVAAYELGYRVTTAALLAPSMLLSALLPAASRHEAEAGRSGRTPFYRAALVPYFALCFGLSGFLIALAPALLEAWLGRAPDGAVLFLQALVLAQLGSLIGGISSTMVRSGGALSIELEYAIVGTAMHIGLSLVGLRWLGPQGVVLGTAVGSLLGGSWFVFRVERWLDGEALGAALKAALPMTIAAAVAGVLAFLASSALPGLEPGRGRGLAMLGVGAATFVLVDGAILLFGFPATGRELRTRADRLLARRGPP